MLGLPSGSTGFTSGAGAPTGVRVFTPICAAKARGCPVSVSLASCRRKGWKAPAGAADTARPVVRGMGRSAPDLVERRFKTEGPDRLWVADITYIPTWSGFLYLSVMLGAFSRRIVAWAMADHLRSKLVLDALNMAVTQAPPFAGGQ